jgi:phage protein U
MTRPIPMLDDLALDNVRWIRQRTHQRLASVPVTGLAGDVQQRTGRGSHEIEIAGVLVGEEVRARLTALQEKAAEGAEVAFAADIATALEMEKVVVAAAAFEERAGRPGYYSYELLLRESPPLPPPAELSPFGGLDGFDLGFDTDVLGDIAGLANQLQDAVEAVTGVLDQLQALAALGDLSLDNPLTPVTREADSLAASGNVGDAGASLDRLLRG